MPLREQKSDRERLSPARQGRADENRGSDAARLVFLHRADRETGTTLDLDHMVRRLADVAVPGFADFASVHLYEQVAAGEENCTRREAPGSAVMRRVATAHHDDAGRLEELRAGRTFVYQPGTAMARFLTNIEPLLIPGVDEEVLAQLPAALDSPDARSVLRDSSVILVPLSAHGATLGFMAFGRRPGRPAFGPADLAACQDMAGRAGLSLHNARLFSQETRTSAVLQRSLLPALPPRLPGMEIAYRYHPGSHTTQVGGDWLDAIPLPGHKVGLVVADVAGHGLHAAIAIGQLRTAVRTLAMLGLPPGQLLAHLGELVQRFGPSRLATFLYGVYDPIARRATFASAGHLPPLLLGPDGKREFLNVPVGAPIGVGRVSFDTLEVSVDDGSLLVLYTDGLVESRDRDIEEGLAALRDELTKRHPSLEEACDVLLRRQHPDGHHDDIALLMARLTGLPHDSVASWLFTPQPEEVRRARSVVGDTLTKWGLGHLRDVTQLLAGELLTNAIRHATQPVGLRLVLTTDTLLCEVSDDHPSHAVLLEPAGMDEHGRGIGLVNALATRWGCVPTPAGKTTWFEHDLPQTAHRQTTPVR
ncbi:ATP-binding SpoIIE family protein phosphatase [Streptomyces sp. HC307]|uniref:ATP-binding SpoIIE family protein phosphatase n=1 Tax=Streptomyces flavusporus TaxID=3385496 RepID=UPI0039171C41